MTDLSSLIKRLKGPIGIFGAGGFIGINLLEKIIKVRSDVIGLSQDPGKSWRIKAAKIHKNYIDTCNLLDKSSIDTVIDKYKPKTIFNLAAYGAYSKQTDISKIYLTNFNSTCLLIEILKKYSFDVYIHSGSQSEYGLNCNQPDEKSELIPNSHYAVSKTAVHYLLKYYGEVEKLPVVHLRFYSVYGPWEEPDRLISTIISNAKKQKLPNLVNPEISRDFIYIDDVIEAILQITNELKPSHYGDAFNIATGKKTTIKELIEIVRKIYNIDELPQFGTMKNRKWDLEEWRGNPSKIQKIFGWKAETTLKKGLIKTYKFYYEKS